MHCETPAHHQAGKQNKHTLKQMTSTPLPRGPQTLQQVLKLEQSQEHSGLLPAAPPEAKGKKMKNNKKSTALPSSLG